MARTLYLALLLVRVYFATTTSYIHPDEHFQGPELITGISRLWDRFPDNVINVFLGEIFGWPSYKTWEFTSDHPIRSIFPLWLVYGAPLTILKWMSEGLGYQHVTSTVVFYVLRTVMLLFSFVLQDWALHDLLSIRRERVLAMMLVASSYVTWVYQTHTFSNSIETTLVLWCMVLIRRIRDHDDRTLVRSCSLLAFLAVLGVFNRITFPAFIIVPVATLIPHLFTKPIRIMVLAATAALTTLIAVAMDTEYYSGNRLHLRQFTNTAVFTPWNNLAYNMDSSNLAKHGLHPFWLHFVANLPQLLGPAFPLIFFSSRTTSLFWSGIVGTAVLSCFSHQEPRFLLPTIPLFLSSIRLPKQIARPWIYSWIIFNTCAAVLFGFYHQAGIVPVQRWIEQQPNVSHVLWWKTYSPPRWLLGNQNDFITTIDLMGRPALQMIKDLSDQTHCLSANSTDCTLLVAPSSTTFLREYVASLEGPVLLEQIYHHKQHIGLDDLDFGDDGVWPTLQRVIGKRGLARTASLVSPGETVLWQRCVCGANIGLALTEQHDHPSQMEHLHSSSVACLVSEGDDMRITKARDSKRKLASATAGRADLRCSVDNFINNTPFTLPDKDEHHRARADRSQARSRCLHRASAAGRRVRRRVNRHSHSSCGPCAHLQLLFVFVAIDSTYSIRPPCTSPPSVYLCRQQRYSRYVYTAVRSVLCDLAAVILLARSLLTTPATRPASRASTTSATSQHNDASIFVSRDAKSMSVVEGPEAALLQYQASMDPTMQGPQYGMQQRQQGMNYSHVQSMPHAVMGGSNYHTRDPASMSQDLSFQQPQQYVRTGSVSVQSGAEMGDERRKKGSAVTATNDKELREMLSKNEGRALREVAQDVIAKERTPMAEKTKQLFAMLWLRAVCKPAKSSVPRNRVYSQYANRCGTERVVPLNPASFGKLVRVIFPGIQTRRLGVRGESKYHYVDLALEDENANLVTNSNWNSTFGSVDGLSTSHDSGSIQHLDFNNIPRLPADTTAFPTQDTSFDMHVNQSSDRGPCSQGRAFAYPESRGMQANAVESMTYAQTLRFPVGNLPTFSENEPVSLPSIQPYLPPRTDQDTAEALYALYRTHCTSLIDSIRFCKEKQFFRLYTSFHGTLTVPVQKLFTHPNLASWIEQCDLVMYRTMVRFVSRLTLQAAPVVVINILSNISNNLYAHISKTFANQPHHVLDAKLRPATVFGGLLYRLIRVNQSAHAAANLLTIDQNREQMWREWVTMVNPKRVMESELPDCGFEETYKILTTEMRGLLEPLQAPAYHDDLYGLQAYNFKENGAFANFVQTPAGPSSRNGQSGVSTENVLDRWSTFLSSLPARFPQASARTLLHCISAVGTSALRDITIMNGVSYGHWWVLKIFVDEMALWMAEMGGFLEPKQTPMSRSSNRMFHTSPIENMNGQSNGGSRMSSAGVDTSNQQDIFGQSAHQQQQHQQSFMPYPPSDLNNRQHRLHPSAQYQDLHSKPHRQQQQQQQQAQQHETDIDDSGIGMSLIEDDLNFSKMGLPGSHVGVDGMSGASDMRVHLL
nr:gpi mannosyltransferase 4 [Quercus suber]